MKNLYLLLIAMVVVRVAYGQCPNDNSSQGGVLSLGTQGVAETSACINAGRYARLSVVAGETYTFSTCDATWDTEMTLYANSGGGALAFDDDGCGTTGGGSSITWVATFTGTLRILIDGPGCTSPSSCAVITMLWQTPPPPANDSCAGALAVSCGSTTAGTTVGSTMDAVANCANTISTGGVWYVLTGTGELVTASLCGASYDTKLDIYEGACGSFLCVGGNNNSTTCGNASVATFHTDPGATYYLLVHGNSNEKGTFSLAITCSAATYTNQECEAAQPICTDESFGGNSDAFGQIQELNLFNSNCLTIEHQSGWFYFSPLTTGTIEFTLTPTAGIDYDFAIWGPYTAIDCPPQEDPLRCSYSSLYVPTGLQLGAGDISEPPSGNAWVEGITVGTGDLNKYYLMLIDNYTADYTAYTLDWNLNGVTLNCSIMLPVELTSFTGQSEAQGNLLLWNTASELNNSHFEIERSTDGHSFETLDVVTGAGTTQEPRSYSWMDTQRPMGLVYYRLRQVDYNGHFDYSPTVAVNTLGLPQLVSIYPNPVEHEWFLRFNSGEDAQIRVDVTDLGGRHVYTRAARLNPGFTTMEINDLSLPSGYYQVSVYGPQGELLSRLPVIR